MVVVKPHLRETSESSGVRLRDAVAQTDANITKILLYIYIIYIHACIKYVCIAHTYFILYTCYIQIHMHTQQMAHEISFTVRLR